MLKASIFTLAFTFLLCGYQLYIYNTHPQPTIIKIYRYDNNKLISAESYINDEARRCE